MLPELPPLLKSTKLPAHCDPEGVAATSRRGSSIDDAVVADDDEGGGGFRWSVLLFRASMVVLNGRPRFLARLCPKG